MILYEDECVKGPEYEEGKWLEKLDMDRNGTSGKK